MVKLAVLIALLSALGAAATMRPTVPPPRTILPRHTALRGFSSSPRP